MSSATASSSNPLVLIVGRLSGPKNEVILRYLREAVIPAATADSTLRVAVVGGPVGDEHRQLEKDHPFLKFEGFQPDLKPFYEKATLVIGAGRVALEAMAHQRPVIAVGEQKYIGPLLPNAVEEAKATNFGDCEEGTHFDWARAAQDLKKMLGDKALREEAVRTGTALLQAEYDMRKLYPKVEELYRDVILHGNLSSLCEIPVLMYHRVVEKEPALAKFNIHITNDNFEKHLLFLQKNGFTPITFGDLLEKKIPSKPIILTFDDGYEDNYLHLYPLLRRYGMKAVIYLLGDRSIRTNTWDTPKGEPETPLLNEKQILEMAKSGTVEFGGHSMTHSSLPGLSKESLDREVRDCKKSLEGLLGKPVVSFAYPYGDYNAETQKAVAEAGYQFGVAVEGGPACFAKDLMAIRRIHIFPDTGGFDFYKKTSGCYLRYKKLFGLLKPWKKL